MMDVDKLPNTLSGTLRIALADLRLVEADPRYRISMNMWHTGQQSPLFEDPRFKEPLPCAVCLAGAVMAKTMGYPIQKEWNPADYPDNDLTRKLMALDSLRMGYTSQAIGQFYGRTMVRVEDMDRYHSYDDEDPDEFHRWMSRMVDELEDRGL